MSEKKFISQRGSRREFLETSTRGAAGVAAGLVVSKTANATPCTRDREIRVGVIGTRSRGMVLARTFAGMENVHVTTVCDIDSRILASARDAVQKLQTTVPQAVADFRQVIADPEIDAVVIATPDHWHAHMTILACQAGKDVYVEKPLAHNIAEELSICHAAQKYDRVVQVGLQQRSAAHFQTALGAVHSGQIGRVAFARAWTSHKRQLAPTAKSTRVPQAVDYDLWTGPAKVADFCPANFHHQWRWSWNYGTGEAGNWGIHMMDIARLGLRVGLPSRVTASGGNVKFKQETPDWMTSQFSYADKTIVWEHRQWSDRGLEGRNAAVAFYGDAGTLVVDRAGWKIYDSKDSRSETGRDGTTQHCCDFISNVLTRQTPIAGPDCAAVSSQLAHLGNMSYRLGREITLPNGLSDLSKDQETARLAGRDYRNGWDLPSV